MISVYHSLPEAGRKSEIRGVSTYNHEILMLGGCYNASLAFNTSPVKAEEWLFQGVGRHIETYSKLGNKVWEGVVNSVSFTVGGRTITAGPLLDMANRIKVVYRFPNYGLGNPLEGESLETDWDVNYHSATRYGYLEAVISGGEGLEDEMLALQEAQLTKLAEPKLVETIAVTDPTVGVSVALSCVGYSRLLDKQVYNLAYAGDPYIDLSEKVADIVNSSLYFTYATGRKLNFGLADVGIDVNPVEADDRTAWGIISDHISKDADADNILFGTFPNMALDLSRWDDIYSYKRSANSSIIHTRSGAVAENSEMVPGGVMLLTDFSKPVEYRISSVRYDLAGDAVSINFHQSKLSHIMGGLMIGGFR